MSPYETIERLSAVLPWAAAAVTVVLIAAVALAILITRIVTNARWRQDAIRNMPVYIQEQLAIRDRRIKEQDHVIALLEKRVSEQDVALRAVQRITWEAAPVTPLERVPHGSTMAQRRKQG